MIGLSLAQSEKPDEVMQCAWRMPALLFAVFAARSLPLFLSIALDMVGRIGRVLAMLVSHRRWRAQRARGVQSPGPVAAAAQASAFSNNARASPIIVATMRATGWTSRMSVTPSPAGSPISSKSPAVSGVGTIALNFGIS